MKKHIILFTLLSILPLSSFAQYEIFFTNNTNHVLYVDTKEPPYQPKNIATGVHNKKLLPYARMQVYTIHYDKGMTDGENFKFSFLIYNTDKNSSNLIGQFNLMIHGDHVGSHLLYSSFKALDNQENMFFIKNPAPNYSKLYDQNLITKFFNRKIKLYADAVKYTIPNPHHDFQSVDEIDYTIEAPQSSYEFSAANPNDLTLLTYNTQIWPTYAWTAGMRLNLPGQRIINIAKKITQYDIVAIEELMDRDYREQLNAMLRIYYPYQYGPVYHNALLSGGVMLYSRWPIVKSALLPYSTCYGIDCKAAKGVLYIRINKLGKYYNIFATHTEANETDGDNTKYIAARKTQILELKQFMHKIVIKPEEPVILLGDLNVDYEACRINHHCQEFNFLTKTLQTKYQPYANINIIPYGSDARINDMCTDITPGMYDYILVLNDKNQKASPKLYQMSRHLLVLRATDDAIMYTGTPYGDTNLSDHFAQEAHLITN